MYFRRVDGTGRHHPQYYSPHHRNWDSNPQPSWRPKTITNHENKSLFQKISESLLPKPLIDVITDNPAGLKQPLWDETNLVRPVIKAAATGYEQNVVERPTILYEDGDSASAENRAFNNILTNNIQEVSQLILSVRKCHV